MSEMTSVLLAIGEENFSSLIRKGLVESQYSFDVLYDEVLNRRYLYEMVEQYQPNIVIIHDKFLPGDKVTTQEKEDEMLEILKNIRLKFDQQIRFVYVCMRPRNDPFLGKLIGLGVYDIVHMERFNMNVFIEQLSLPPKFANVSKFNPGEFNMKDQAEDEEDGHIQEDNDLNPDISLGEEKKISVLFKKSNLSKLSFPFPKLTPAENKDDSNENDGSKSIDEDDWVFEEEKPITSTSTPVVGTVIIAVAAVEEHLGATNTAISIATYLNNNGYDVALVEANRNMDFDRIHSLIEGERGSIEGIEFNYNGFDHIKYRENFDLGSVYTNYQYVVLDIGDIRDSPYSEELNRAHIKCVIASANEWKYHWIEEFLNNCDAYDLVFLVPCSDSRETNDLAARLKYYDVFPLDKHSSPYMVPEESAKVYGKLLSKYQVKQRVIVNKKLLLLTGILGAAITAVCFLFFLIN